ncbi:MAG: MIP family channel protein [Endomicrobia bacterium]|nr:MIP family channel protein [Endomicrobiia bacterium]
MKKYVAELLGAMFLVVMGCGSAVFAGGQVGFLGISFAFGLTVLALAYAIGPVSGCHVNPAVTIGVFINGGIEKKAAMMYIIFQFIGAAVGAFIIYMMASNFFTAAVTSVGQNGYGAASPLGYSMGVGFIAEVVFTALFIMVILGATSPKANGKFAGIAIGLTLVLIHIVCIPITGTSVNPARSFGPALFAGATALKQLWLFIVAPVLGAVLGAYLWKMIGSDDKSA